MITNIFTTRELESLIHAVTHYQSSSRLHAREYVSIDKRVGGDPYRTPHQPVLVVDQITITDNIPRRIQLIEQELIEDNLLENADGVYVEDYGLVNRLLRPVRTVYSRGMNKALRDGPIAPALLIDIEYSPVNADPVKMTVTLINLRITGRPLRHDEFRECDRCSKRKLGYPVYEITIHACDGGVS